MKISWFGESGTRNYNFRSTKLGDGSLHSTIDRVEVGNVSRENSDTALAIMLTRDLFKCGIQFRFAS